MTEYEMTTLSVIVKPKGEPIYSERATIIEMTDEAAGPFITLRQINDETERGEIKVDLEEWPTIQEAIGLMLIECFHQENTTK
jgi:hypothetical protein